MVLRRPERSVECSDSEKNMSAYADQNHAPSLTCVRLDLLLCCRSLICRLVICRLCLLGRIIGLSSLIRSICRLCLTCIRILRWICCLLRLLHCILPLCCCRTDRTLILGSNRCFHRRYCLRIFRRYAYRINCR